MAKLYIVPTPIGNLEDITLRALRILKEVDVIYAEDTRTSGNLLRHFNIDKKIFAYHQYNEHKTVDFIAEHLSSGVNAALISDAGTPGISDPGFLLVRECISRGIDVECLPGATAFVPALVNSGFPTDRFWFEGFLPHKKGRQTRLKVLKDIEHTIVLYESPFRLVKLLEELATFMGNERKACVSRELTKMYEENRRGSLSELLEHYKKYAPKGEIVVIVGGNSGKEETVSE